MKPPRTRREQLVDYLLTCGAVFGFAVVGGVGIACGIVLALLFIGGTP